MNLYFLVEGDMTETRVYDSWVPYVFNGFTPVEDHEKAKDSNYYIVSGGGYPQYIDRIIQSFENLNDVPALYEHFFICIDSEEMSKEEKWNEVQEAVDLALDRTKVRIRNASLQVHIIVQNCCIETWFLGNQKVMSRTPTSERLLEFKRFFDVIENDPEKMPTLPGFQTRASFHLEYLKEMFRERSIRYTKSNPGCVLEDYYVAALHDRHQRTEHLRSLGILFSVWALIGGKMPTER